MAAPSSLPTLAIVGLTLALGGLTFWMAKRILEPAERLDRARVVLEDAYNRARAESLRDALTGLGNHRSFQEELERQWVGSTRYHTRLPSRSSISTISARSTMPRATPAAIASWSV